MTVAIMSGCGGVDTSIDTNTNSAPDVVRDLGAPANALGQEEQAQRDVDGQNDAIEDLDITFEDLQRGPKVDLLDVSGGTASGTGWTTLKDDKTYHRVIAKDMPALEADYFYEGWLVKNPALGQFFSTGEMTQDATGEWLLEYTHDGDVTDHEKVVITLEPNDGDPAPAAHIIEN